MTKVPADLIAFVIALCASLILTIPIRYFALRYGMVDKPGPRKVHLKPIPLLGGIAIFLGFALAVLLTRHGGPYEDRKSTRLNSSHPSISYAVFCWKKQMT